MNFNYPQGQSWSPLTELKLGMVVRFVYDEDGNPKGFRYIRMLTFKELVLLRYENNDDYELNQQPVPGVVDFWVGSRSVPEKDRRNPDFWALAVILETTPEGRLLNL